MAWYARRAIRAIVAIISTAIVILTISSGACFAKTHELSKEQKVIIKSKWWPCTPEQGFRYVKVIKYNRPKSRELRVWEPITLYANTLPAPFRKVFLEGERRIHVTYDEVWIVRNTAVWSDSEIKRNWNDLDIVKFYWLNGKIQACEIDKVYEGNPYTGEKLSKPEHKIYKLFTRNQVLNDLEG